VKRTWAPVREWVPVADSILPEGQSKSRYVLLNSVEREGRSESIPNALSALRKGLKLVVDRPLLNIGPEGSIGYDPKPYMKRGRKKKTVKFMVAAGVNYTRVQWQVSKRENVTAEEDFRMAPAEAIPRAPEGVVVTGGNVAGASAEVSKPSAEGAE
jgi:hypothetical protein